MSTPARADGVQGGAGSGAQAGAAVGAGESSETAAGGSTSTAAAGGSTRTAAAGRSTRTTAPGGSTDGKMAADALHKSALKQKKNAKADWWQFFEPVLLKPEGGKGWQCKLKCVRGDPPCGQLLSALNPSKSASDHFTIKGCKGFRVSLFVQACMHLSAC